MFSGSRAAFVSVQNLSKASGISKKVEQTKISLTKTGPADRNFWNNQIVSKYIKNLDVWTWFCRQIKTQSNGVRYLLVAVDKFFSDWSEFKQGKQSMPKTLWKLSKNSFSKNTPLNFWDNKRTENGGIFKKFCKEKDIEIYSTIIAFAEGAIQPLKHIMYLYFEDSGTKSVSKMQQLFLPCTATKNELL